MAAGFRISDFVVIESLPPGDAATGRITFEWLTALVIEYEPRLRVRMEQPRSAQQFCALMAALAEEARSTGARPLIHIECHGDSHTGLWFADGSSLGWSEFSEHLTRTNIATGFNLLVAVSACYGAYLGAQFQIVAPAPAFALVAPTEGIYPDEVMAGFRTFYRELLLTGDAGAATRALSQHKLTEGSWFSDLAETWYERLMVHYAETYLTPEAMREWAKDLSRKKRAEGLRASVGGTFRALRAIHRSHMTGKYFDLFFSTTEVPSCAERFRPVRDRVEKKLAALKAEGRLAL